MRTNIWAMAMVMVVAVLCVSQRAGAVVHDTFTFTNVDSISGLETANATGSYTFNGYRVSGTLSAIHSNTYGEEAIIVAGVNAASTNLQPFPGILNFGTLSASNVWTGPITPVSVTAGNTFSFDFDETYVDGPPDATWDTITIDVVTMIHLQRSGAIAQGTVAFYDLTVTSAGFFDIDTFGSNFDTELAIWNSAGTLLAEHDDVDYPSNPTSRIAMNLGLGQYLIAVAGYDTVFGNGPLVSTDPNDAFGDYVLNVRSDGEARLAVAADAVPEPATASLTMLALASLALVTRRRRIA